MAPTAIRVTTGGKVRLTYVDSKSGREIKLRVAQRIRESDHVVSLVLATEQATDWMSFKAGQHLPIRLDVPERPIATYTISSSPRDQGFYRISVKREPNGLGGSAFLHEHGQVGRTFTAMAPRGDFHLRGERSAVLLLTGGIGVTPALSMLKELARDERTPVFFVHAARNRAEHSFRDEVRALAEPNSHIKCFVAYAEGTAEDLAEGFCDHIGLIDRAVLRRILPLDAYTTYLCGPLGFMHALRDALTSLGLPPDTILQEHFGSARPTAPSIATSGADRTSHAEYHVGFQKSQITAKWSEPSGSLLELAESVGLTPDFSCRTGVCGTCACTLVSGEVEYVEPPVEEPPAGQVLLCCSRPKGAVELDL